MERSTMFNGKIQDFDWAIFNSINQRDLSNEDRGYGAHEAMRPKNWWISSPKWVEKLGCC